MISDDSTLEDAIKNNVGELEALFNSTNGVANTLYDLVDPYLGAAGYLTNRKDSFDSSVTYFNDRIDNIQTSIESGADSLRKQYEDLQSQLVVLLNTQSFLQSFSGGGFF